MSLGLGLLTKEFTILIWPLVVWVFCFRPDPISKRMGMVLGVVAVVFFILLPWLIQVDQVTGSPFGGLLQRGAGHGKDALSNPKAWGLRSFGDLVDMVRFFDRPAWFSQLMGWTGFIYCLWRARKKRRMEEGILVGFVLIWLGTFAVFKALPLDLRRLIPLLPVFSILTAAFFHAVWLRCREYTTKLGIPKKIWVGVFGLMFAFYLINDLKPKRVLGGFEPLCVLHSPRRPYLEDEMRTAVQCLPKGAQVATNYKSLLYFYSRGDLFPSGIPLTLEKKARPWMKEAPKPHRAPVSSSIILYDFYHKGRRMVMDEATLLRRLRESQVEFLAFFQSGNPRWAPRPLEDYFRRHSERYRPICQTEGVQVYRIVDISPSPADPGS
jgi:hypothetical protein